MLPSPTNPNSRKMGMQRYSVGSIESTGSHDSLSTAPVFEEDVLGGIASEWEFNP